jgi:hypothetical protein
MGNAMTLAHHHHDAGSAARIDQIRSDLKQTQAALLIYRDCMHKTSEDHPQPASIIQALNGELKHKTPGPRGLIACDAEARHLQRVLKLAG